MTLNFTDRVSGRGNAIGRVRDRRQFVATLSKLPVAVAVPSSGGTAIR